MAKHPPCPQLCPKEKGCGHQRLALCHGNALCPTGCSQPCLLECEHGPCRGLCKWVCDPCVKAYIGENDLATSEGPILCSLGHVIQQPNTFEGVFDHLLAKMGRKLSRFGDEVSERERNLKDSLDPFMRGVRLNPMAQDFNKRNLTARGGEVREELDHLTDFRDQVVLPFERSIVTCNKVVLGAVDYNLLFHLRFDILEYRARALLVQDILVVTRRLMLLNDPSQGVHRQAESMREHAVLDCLNCIQYCEASATCCTESSPCVRVELLSQQAHFSYLADIASSSTGVASGSVPAVLQEALLLCRRFPNTAGVFRETIYRFQNYVRGDDLRAIPLITSENGRETEKAWGMHVVGHMRTCGNKHSYSTESFPNGCPECDRKVEFDDEATKKARAFLNEDGFMKRVH